MHTIRDYLFSCDSSTACAKHTQHAKLEGSGACSPREIFENRCSEMASGGYILHAKSFVNIFSSLRYDCNC